MTPKERGLCHMDVPFALRDALKAGAHSRGMTVIQYLAWLHDRAGPPLS